MIHSVLIVTAIQSLKLVTVLQVRKAVRLLPIPILQMNCSLGRSRNLPKFIQLRSGKARIKTSGLSIIPVNPVSTALQGTGRDYVLMNEELSTDSSWMGKWFIPSWLLGFAVEWSDKEDAQTLDFYKTYCKKKVFFSFYCHSEYIFFSLEGVGELRSGVTRTG